ncbi:hypothetical protein DY000_02055315 [Brassica cretica]|uniref:Uncharacterized protein n=1 Tax=Brassica cretica TaxID=69181 RepID=A0ABQ7ACT0_BRACR|nr:hypothetical protein DY000_02055315 [Brassica cretica]
MVGMQAKPSFRHEIDHKPDAGFFKFYASVLGLDTVIGPTPTFFRICRVSYAKCSYRFDFPSLVNWLCSAGLNYVYVVSAIDHLNKALSEFVSSPVVGDSLSWGHEFDDDCYVDMNNYYGEDDLLDESLISAWLPTEEASHVKIFRTEESIHQSSFDEITNNMRDLSLSWGHEFDDDCYVDMNNYFVEP